ncbi:RHS repeat-associated core domain-containing protein [Streptomyces olivaceiscleroticus]|uniref:Type IV secretion protein Rhs n=1 Tax=Streptomyces olivaceiscleroticus TaxID=68245 RepID=A0ABN1AI40_9ACTN
MVDLNPLHYINQVNHAMGESMASVLEFLGISDPAVDPDGVREIARKWRALARALEDANRDAGAALEDVVWEGKAAEAFHLRAKKAREQADHMAGSLRNGAKALDQFADEAHEMITEIGVICVEIAEMEAAGLALSVLTAGISAAATTIAAGARAARIIALVARIEESGTALARTIRAVMEVIRGLSRALRALKEIKGVATAGRMTGEGMKFSALDAALQDPGAFKDPGKLAHVLGEGAVLGVGAGVLGKALGKGLKTIKPSALAKIGKDGSGLARLRLRPGKGEELPTSIRAGVKRCERDPIDVATGDMLLHTVDVSLPGTLPLVVERTHLSSCRWGGWFGTSWASTLDQRLQADDESITYVAPDGARLVYPALEPDATEPVHPVTGTGPALTWDDEVDGGMRLTDADTGLAYVFHSPRPIDDETAVDLPLQAITDRNGNRITVHYTDDGTPSEISHSGGYRLALDRHRSQPRIAAIRLLDPEDPNAPGTTVVSYGYDETGHLTEVYNSSGLPLRFTYDEVGRVTSWTDRNDSSYSYIYDECGRVVRTEGSAGHLTGTLEYDDATHTTTVTDSLGHSRVYEHNDAYRLIRETDPLGNTTHQQWDDQHRLTAVTDPLGHTVHYRYDAAGRPTDITRPDGRTVKATYNDLGLPAKTVDADGAVWRREYDTHGNLTALTDPAGATTRCAYTADGHLASMTDALGNTTRVECDPAGLPLVITDPLGATTRYARDLFGRPTTLTDPLGAVTCLEWTPEGKLVRQTQPDGATESWTYDGEGNCTTQTDALGQTTTYEYTHFDLLTARTDPDGTRHTFTHDHELRLIEVTNPQGLTWSYTYDPAGRLTAETDFDDRTVTYTHDAVGHTTAYTSPLGDTIRYTYDELGQVATKDAVGAVTRYAYDPAGRLRQATSDDHELSLAYDAAGRLTTETTNGRTVTHAYDALGRPVQRTTPTGATTRYDYDAAGNRVGLITPTGHTLASSHDPAGRELRRTLDDGTLSLAYTWDPTGRLTRQHIAAGTGTIRTRDYRYRADGYLTALDDSRTGPSHYTLDPNGRVTRVSAHNWSETYAYDTAGNQTSATWPDTHLEAEARGERTYSGTRVNTAGAIRYEYDAGGRLTLRQKTRLSRKPDTWRYTWNAEDQLTEVTTPDGTRWRYTYDPLGRRTAKLRLAADGTVAERVEFAWDGPTLIEQTTTAPDQLPHPVTLTWDHDGLNPVGQSERRLDTSTQEEIDARFFAIATDLIGTPTELVDTEGNLAWHVRTTLWGTTTWPATSTAYTPLRFPGQYYDPETGLHYNHHRYYDPATARYLAPDPLGLAPAPNPVAYVHNPHTWTDPVGLAPCEIFYRVMSKKEFNKLGPNGEITVKGTENFVTQERGYVQRIAEQFARRGGRQAEKYTHLVTYRMEGGTREALIAAGRGSGDNIAAVADNFGIHLEEIGSDVNYIHVKMEREGLNFGLRPGSVDVFNSRIIEKSHELL